MWIGITAGLAAGALWGLTFVVPLMVPEFGAILITAARYAAYGAFSCLLLIGRPWRALLMRHWRGLIVMALLGNLVYSVLMVLAVQRTGAAITALIIGCLPVLVPLTASLGDWHRLRRLAPALIFILAGLLLQQWPALQARPDWLGLVFAAGALAVWNIYALVNARYLEQHPDLQARDWASLVGLGCVLGLPFLAPVYPLLDGGWPDASRAAWAWLGLLSFATGIGSAWLATWAWNIASQRLPVALAGQLIVSETLFALLYAFVLEGRGPDFREVAAIALVIGGVTWGVRVLQPKAH